MTSSPLPTTAIGAAVAGGERAGVGGAVDAEREARTPPRRRPTARSWPNSYAMSTPYRVAERVPTMATRGPAMTDGSPRRNSVAGGSMSSASGAGYAGEPSAATPTPAST